MSTIVQDLKDIQEKLYQLIDNLDQELVGLNNDIAETEQQLSNSEKEKDGLLDPDEIEVCDCKIDFGCGILHYKKPDNLRIQQYMEELAEKIQGHSFVS